MQYVNSVDQGQSVLALKAAIACREQIIKFPCRETAFMSEYLGDGLMAGNKTGTANEAYRKAVQLLTLTCGPSHPYSVTAAKKLAAAQACLNPRDVSALMGMGDCNFCGGSRLDGLTGRSLAKCGRCHGATYCCQEHQARHWPMHKKSCSPKG